MTHSDKGLLMALGAVFLLWCIMFVILFLPSLLLSAGG